MNPQNLDQMESQLTMRARQLSDKKKKVGTIKNRIGFSVDLVSKMFALLLDILGALAEFIPFLGGFIASILGIGGNIAIGLGYFFIGVKPLTKNPNGKNAVKRSFIIRIVCFFFELIPFVNILPTFSIAVWYTNGAVKKEDKEYNMSIRNELKQIEEEERVLRRDMQQLGSRVQEYQQEQYNNEQDEQTLQNQINEQDEDDRMAA
jgi:RNase P protein component